jgi:ADP-heptose:LPS heptosyltransferase
VEQVASCTASSPLDFVGKLSIRETASVIGKCSLFVSNDTGLMHVAVALGVPVVVIFGPTDPRRTGPYSDQSVVVTPDIDCAPCYDGWRAQCDTHPCLDAISVDDVVAAAQRLISRRQENAGGTAI